MNRRTRKYVKMLIYFFKNIYIFFFVHTQYFSELCALQRHCVSECPSLGDKIQNTQGQIICPYTGLSLNTLCKLCTFNKAKLTNIAAIAIISPVLSQGALNIFIFKKGYLENILFDDKNSLKREWRNYLKFRGEEEKEKGNLITDYFFVTHYVFAYLTDPVQPGLFYKQPHH